MIEKSQLRPGKRLKTQHKVFISFHNCDLKWKEMFVEEMEDRIIDESVDTGEIVDSNKKVADVRRIIREDFIRPATVTVVLIGRKTWQRKHVDWEIGASLLARNHKRRNGLLGIVLPDHPNHGSKRIKPNLIPPRLAANCRGNDPFAKIYDWPEPFAPAQVHRAIAEAFRRREGADPDNSREPFANNWSGPWDEGWQYADRRAGMSRNKGRDGRRPQAKERRKVFVSFHEDNDTECKDEFVKRMTGLIEHNAVKIDYVRKANRSVGDIQRYIRDEYLADTTVTVVLIGVETWQRKHVDWEIGASLRDTEANERGGLIGIVLPEHSDYEKQTKYPRRLPPRLADNLLGEDPYAQLYDWPKPFEPETVVRWIEKAYVRRDGQPPINTLRRFGKNRTTDPERGWR